MCSAPAAGTHQIKKVMDANSCVSAAAATITAPTAAVSSAYKNFMPMALIIDVNCNWLYVITITAVVELNNNLFQR
jgi:hypothetical protein